MDPKVVAVKDTDTLKQAIDLLSRHKLIDLAVVDKDGDLVGSVSSYELLRVCLPDYILWMDDLSPIINFEPFAGVLRNESNTWLAEVMSRDYVVVSEDQPAMQVAKEITKNHALQAYVTRGKKLVGVVTLQQFVTKVFRG
jgi:CBS domain-containing protein